MADTTKKPSIKDGQLTLKHAYNDVDATISTSGFLTGKVGHKVEMAISTTSVANDTETYTFFDGATQLYQIEVIYTSGTRDVMMSAERIS